MTEVEFDEAESPCKSIALEITIPSEEEDEIWDCYSVTSLKVEIRTNDTTLKHARL